MRLALVGAKHEKGFPYHERLCAEHGVTSFSSPGSLALSGELFDLLILQDCSSEDVRLLREAHPESRTLLLLEDEEPEPQASVGSYLREQFSWDELSAALMLVGRGGTYVDGRVQGTPSEENGEIRLTAREHEVLRRLAEGWTNRGIAGTLGITENTVKFHLNAIFRKLGAESRTEALIIAAREGLLAL